MIDAGALLDALEAATWATYREDKIRVIENFFGITHTPHYPIVRTHDPQWDPERLAIRAKVAAAGLLP